MEIKDSLIVKKKHGKELSVKLKKHPDGKEEVLRIIRLRGMPICDKKAITIHTVHSKDGVIEHIDIKIDGFKIYRENYKDGRLTERMHIEN